ncbi:MAG: electron transport complex subunit RsxC [Thiothrix sp.]|nr:electron transport complex subunit RsxC [Thiothrix sp.]HPQ94564.1 electron transport complex subunit RsxC [Thiolinea sp.]
MNRLQQLFRYLFPPHGLTLDGHKQVSTSREVTTLAASQCSVLYLPLQQHAGSKARLKVAVGERVLRGQCLTWIEPGVSVPVHAPTSGHVLAIEARPVAHPSGLSDTCIVLGPDGLDEADPQGLPPLPDYTQLDDATLRCRICEAGIVGLGGAVFPAAIKLNVKPDVPIRQLIINGAECEPWITCDDMLMRTRADEILAGASLMLQVLASHAPDGKLTCLIGIEDNKPEAIASMQTALMALTLREGRSPPHTLRVVPIPTRYPAGGEKQLIRQLTGQEVPSGGRPADIGMICHNVATARAIYRAVALGEPLMSRYVTVTGDGVTAPANFEVPFGMPVGELVRHAGGMLEPDCTLNMGGSMMGMALHSEQVPVVKATNCIRVLRPLPEQAPDITLPCIRCGRCAEACPMSLLPQQLFWHAHARELEQAEALHLFDCIECGCCTHVCPSHIPLVSYYRFAKADIRSKRTARTLADQARTRHEFREQRLERARRERAEKLARHKAAVKQSPPTERNIPDDSGTAGVAATPPPAADDPRNAAIQAALERAQARKAALTQQEPRESGS